MTEGAVTVVVPTHERRALLTRTLDTVLGQEGVRELRVVVVDDASTDGTGAALAARRDERLSVCHHDVARGPAASRNTGLARVESPWVAFVDDDDLWSPLRVRRQLDALERTGAGWACSASVLVDEDLEILGQHPAPAEGDVADEMLERNAIPGGGSSVLARTELVRAVGGFDPELRGTEDWDLWIRLALASPLACVDRPDVAYMVHGANLSKDVEQMVENLDRVTGKHADAAAARGISHTERWRQEYLLGVLRTRGNGPAAARMRARIAIADRRPGELGAVVATLLAPRAVERRHLRRQRTGDPAWLAEAEAWLAPLRGREGPARSSRTTGRVGSAAQRSTLDT